MTDTILADPPLASELAVLRSLARQFPRVDLALAEIARLEGELTLPREVIHVVSDVHGEFVKLRHILNNGSGTLRPIVEGLFAGRLAPDEIRECLTLLFYPGETLERLAPQLESPEALRLYCRRTLRRLGEVIRALGRGRTRERLHRDDPAPFRSFFAELLSEPSPTREGYVDAMIDSFVAHGYGTEVVRRAARIARNLAVDELIVAGDCYDRGPRADRVVEYLRRQPSVSFVWGNHDAAWLGACLGQPALIGHVLRVSIRYRRLSQLEEGYGITLQPLEHLVREVYASDPATRFRPRGEGLREAETLSRMQKAAAVLQFKLEGQTIARNPEMGLDHRRLLHRIDHAAGTIEIDGTRHPLADRSFPTIDPANPYALTPEEQACIDRIRGSFLASPVLWDHMRFLCERGSMWLRRDDHLIFHGCVPVDESGGFLSFPIDGQERSGRALFDAFESVITRALADRREKDLDLLWYLWCGPRSPLFGKDRITTLERDLVADPATHVETKNPYFKLIHEAPFCARILAEFGVPPDSGMIVNGHVPVKIEKGESPLKRSGRAITIDGAFSQAYGDHGYTLLIESERTALALHHHFESVEAAVKDGVDIIPTVTTVRQYDAPRRVAAGERGEAVRAEIALLERLVAAYRRGALRTGGVDP
jgi:fructose-1,6-bisphosphatase-3